MHRLPGILLDLTARGHHALNVRLFDCGSYLRFYQELITRVLCRPGYVLHLGSGDATTLSREMELSSAKSRFVCLDTDLQSMRKNPARLKVVADAVALPFKDDIFQAVCSEHLLEHLSNPADVFRESRRVLLNGGHFFFAAPNGWSYIALLARMVPLRFHAALVSFGVHAEGEHRHFPTYYRANSVFSIRRLAKSSRLSVERLEGFVGEPCYTLSLPVVHLIAIAWHKLLESVGLHLWCGLTLIGVLTKREAE